MWDGSNILDGCSWVSQGIGQRVIVITDRNSYVLGPCPAPGLCLMLEIEQEMKKSSLGSHPNDFNENQAHACPLKCGHMLLNGVFLPFL